MATVTLSANSPRFILTKSLLLATNVDATLNSTKPNQQNWLLAAFGKDCRAHHRVMRLQGVGIRGAGLVYTRHDKLGPSAF